jgi:hypothetical protein
LIRFRKLFSERNSAGSLPLLRATLNVALEAFQRIRSRLVKQNESPA